MKKPAETLLTFIFVRKQLLNVHPGPRLSSQRELQQTPLLRNIDFNKILQKQTKPPFKPPEDHLNCDPSLELEEMIVEAKPLHKKKKRLAKQRSQQKESSDSPAESNFIKEFLIYNRCKELKRRAMEKKENEWQEELNTLMANSQVTNLQVIEEATNEPADTTQTTTRAQARLRTVEMKSTWTNTDAITSTQAGTSKVVNTNNTNPTTTATKESEPIDYIDRTPSPKPIT